MYNNSASKKIYNIIFAGGNIPPMTACLLCVQNGYETYVYTDRGRSFSGIEMNGKFHNMGFDTEKTQTLDDKKAFETVVDAVKSIREKDGSAFFNFYSGESRGFKCAAVAANAGLGREDFHIFMLEDGIDSYKKFDANYGEEAAKCNFYEMLFKLTGGRKWLSGTVSNKIYAKIKSISCSCGIFAGWAKKYLVKQSGTRFAKAQKDAEKLFEKILCGKNNFNDDVMAASYKWPFVLACMDNFTYLLQDKSKITDIVVKTGNKELNAIFDTANNCQNSQPKVIYKNLAQRVGELTEDQKKQYLTVMFGKHSEEVNALFSRKQRGDIPAPSAKLVYINARFDTMFAHPVTNTVYGIGGISNTGNVPHSYAELDEKYKIPFLFDSEADWNIFEEAMSGLEEYSDAPQELVKKARSNAFDMYADYIFAAKLIYILYGDKYDISIKNHPRTDIGASYEWSDIYKLPYGENKRMDYGRCLDKALADFHRQDSIGRYISLVRSSLSTECFEYVNGDISFCGQPSSVYNGLSDNAQIPFIISDTDLDITGGGSAHVAYSAASARYKAGKMKYTDSQGAVKDTVYMNTGNILKACAFAAEKEGDTALASQYEKLFAIWMGKTHPSAKDIDPQGFAIK